NFNSAELWEVNFTEANLNGANFSRANLNGANLSRANLNGANLTEANLRSAVLVNADMKGATLTQCSIYGVSAWNVELEGTKQENLVITDEGEPIITVDNLKIAQFLYLLLNNAEIRDAINTITTKVVLILGRFTPERKQVLDALRDELRKRAYLPVLFDFEKPRSRNLTETISTLAHLARFVIADLTEPSSIPQELQAIVPTLAVPVKPLLLEGKREYAMFIDFPSTYHWILPIHFYRDQTNLLASLQESVIEPAEQKARELEKR
ncbi:MAG: pentapeptide repeat-containing protein, partial [Ktedonobacteraceae bacterium]